MSCPSSRCQKAPLSLMLRLSMVTVDPSLELQAPPPSSSVTPRKPTELESDSHLALERPFKVTAELWLASLLVAKEPINPFLRLVLPTGRTRPRETDGQLCVV